MNITPVKLIPACKEYLWAGTRLKKEFGIETELEKIAETWEFSAHKDGESIIKDGEFKGMSFPEYIEKNGKECIGENAAAFEFFPILIKFIDAGDKLSIQVHPSDEYALEHEGEYGKTEMWYVMDCDEGSYLYYGFNRSISRDEFAKRIEENTLLEVLNKVEIKPGDVFFIDSGTIHAIGKGALICEIQQNSNTTYRVYDYNRRDKNGNLRELHVNKAIDVTDLNPPKEYHINGSKLAECKYFTVDKFTCDGEIEIPISEKSFKSVIVISGEGNLHINDTDMQVTKGDSIFVPAQNGEITLSGVCEVIVSYV